MAIATVNLTDTINSWRIKFNQVSTKQGDLTFLTTNASSNLVDAINEINLGGTAPPFGTLQDVSIDSALDGSFVRYNANNTLWEKAVLGASDITQFETSLTIQESQIVFVEPNASQTYVNNAISGLIDGAPATLDTLNELAAAMDDDAGFLSLYSKTSEIDSSLDSLQSWVQGRDAVIISGLQTEIADGLDSLQGWVIAQDYATNTALDLGLDSLQGWVIAQDYATNDGLDSLQGWVQSRDNIIISNLQTEIADGLDSLQGWVIAQDYATNTALDLGLDSLQGWVIGESYLKQTSLAPYYTQHQVNGLLDSLETSLQTWVGNQNYLTSSDISDMATQTWVGNQNYLTTLDLNGLSDVTITSAAVGQVLKYDGSGWVNGTDNEGSGGITSESNDLTSAVVWANIPDANVPVSAVTQHQAALTITYSQISDPENIPTGIDDVIDDTSPQLGGNLDLNQKTIDGTGNIDITGSITTTGTDAGADIVSGNDIKAAGNVIAYSSSDITMKKNIRRIPKPLDMVKQMDGIMFDWTDDVIHSRGGIDGYYVRRQDVGLLAQQVVKVIPDIVVKRPADGKLAVKYEGVIPVLLEAIKELEIVTTSKEQFKALESRVDIIENVNNPKKIVPETSSADAEDVIKLRKELDELKLELRKVKNIGIRNQSAISKLENES